MIFYGSTPVHLESTQPEHAICPNCQTQGSLVYSVYRSHAHLYWIPLFPMGKSGGSICQNCQEELEPKEMGRDMRMEYDALKSEARGPLWQFAGLGIIAALVIGGIFMNRSDNQVRVELLSAPQIGDVYRFKDNVGDYTTFKIDLLKGDSVKVIPNMYGINMSSGFDDIDLYENYSIPDAYYIHKSELGKLEDDGKLYDIIR